MLNFRQSLKSSVAAVLIAVSAMSVVAPTIASAQERGQDRDGRRGERSDNRGGRGDNNRAENNRGDGNRGAQRGDNNRGDGNRGDGQRGGQRADNGGPPGGPNPAGGTSANNGNRGGRGNGGGQSADNCGPPGGPNPCGTNTRPDTGNRGDGNRGGRGDWGNRTDNNRGGQRPDPGRADNNRGGRGDWGNRFDVADQNRDGRRDGRGDNNRGDNRGDNDRGRGNNRDGRIENRNNGRFEWRGDRHWDRPQRVVVMHPRPSYYRPYFVERSRYYNRIPVYRPYGIAYPGFGFYYRDNDAFRFLGLTALSLAVFSQLNESQQRAHEAAFVEATSADIGEPIYWNEGGRSGRVTAVRDGTTNDGRQCREFQQEVTIGGDQTEAYGTACLQPDGSWQVVND